MPHNKHDDTGILHFDIDELMIQNQAVLVTYSFLEVLAPLSEVVILLAF